MIRIYAKNLKRKKLYYFMKIWKFSELIKYRQIKTNNFINTRRVYSNLYNDFKNRSNRKENMRMKKFYDESEFYTFSPLINNSGYLTYRPNSFRSSTPYNSRFGFYKKYNPVNQKWSNFSEPYYYKRNNFTENNLYDNENEFDYNNFHNYPYNNRVNKYENSKNKTNSGFYTPKYCLKKKNIFSNKDEDINTQISEYLNNFQKNKKRLDSLYPYKNNFINMSNNRDLYSKKINRPNNNLIFRTSDNIKGKGKSQIINSNKNLYNSNFKKTGEIENYFNKKTSKKYNSNLKLNKERLGFKKNQNNKNQIYDKNKKLKHESKDFFCSFNKDNHYINNNSKKNSNTSLNPSSLGIEHLKTFYTNIPKTSIKNLNNAYSNINSASSRILDTHSNYLHKLKMTSGEVNEYFYDFNSGRKDTKDKNDDQKSVQSLQSLSDSKMLEIANHYISEEDSTENYQMNNIIYNRRKHMDK